MVEPQLTARLNNLEGSVPTINGDIKVSWSINERQLAMSLQVPNNSLAHLLLPDVNDLLVTQQGIAVTDISALTPGEYNISGIVSF
jgi:alpha-L-rhamnosidase